MDLILDFFLHSFRRLFPTFFTPPTRERKLELRKQDEGILWVLIYMLCPVISWILHMWTRRTITPLLTSLVVGFYTYTILSMIDPAFSIYDKSSYYAILYIAMPLGSYIGINWDVSRAKENKL